MSNVIKAMNIRYKDDVKKLDFNKEADGFVQLYAENLAHAEEIESDSNEDSPELLSGEYAEDPENAGDTADPDMHGPKEEAPQKKHPKPPVLSEQEAAAVADVSVSEEMLKEVREECDKMRNETREECDRIIDEMRASLEVERRSLYDEAKEQGYKDGAVQAQKEYDALKQELEQKIAEADVNFEKKVDELEPAFVELMIKLIQKITGILVDDRRDLILHIIRQSILGMENSNSYIIHVSKDDFDFVNSKKQELLYELKGNVVEVVEDPVLSRAQCTIETDTRIFDCSLDVQLKNLISNIRLLSEQ